MKNVLPRIKEILESRYFIYILAGITILSYFTGWYYLPFYCLPIFAILLIISDANFNCIASMVMLYAASWKDLSKFNFASFWFVLWMAIIALALVVFGVDIYKKRKEYYKRIKKDVIFVTMTALFLFMALSILWSPNKLDAARGFGEYVTPYFFYVLARFRLDRTNRTKYHIMEGILVFGFVTAVEALVLFLKLNQTESVVNIITHKMVHLGWALSTHFMAIVNLAAIVGVYCFMKSKYVHERILVMVAECLFIFINIITVCRGGYLGLLASIPCVLAYYIYHGIRMEYRRYKWDMLYFAGILLVCGLYLMFFVKNGFFEYVLEYLKERGFNSSGRDKVYAVAWNVFQSHWMFGGGIGSAHFYLEDQLHWNLYNYHNHYLQMLGTLGIVGATLFTVYVVESIRINWKKDSYNLLILIGIVYFLSHGMVDTIYFNPNVMPLLSILLASVFPDWKPNFNGKGTLNGVYEDLKLYRV